MDINSTTLSVILLSYLPVGSPLVYAPKWVVTGFIEEGRVLGLIPSVSLHPHVYIPEEIIFITMVPKMLTPGMEETSSPDLV